ncbi:MAG: hypothetical protein GWN62_09250, partial [Aliifodinibius sp.]|nr:hypothetical protein [Fodinibius sp.]
MPINTLDFDNGSMPINYLEIRIYYREKGTFEWLPAGRTEWTNYFYNPDQGEYAVCTGKETGLPGGQPGGYNDYSELPDEDWQDVITFNNRVFWASKSQVIFSNRNNVFAYAARNTIPCPKGEFRGIKVHTFYGESEQNGRVIIFGSEETYFGEFTGNKIIEPIRVSIDNVGEFPVDGSDFDVKTRSTITAFSSRSATVADGILYFWGQSGIYADNGVGTPEKISLAIEPELFDLYDKNKTLDIHCNYNANTKEIVWYFTPADTSEGLTKMLVYNIKTAKYLIWTHEKKIDWAESIKIENEQVGRLISGPRTIV